MMQCCRAAAIVCLVAATGCPLFVDLDELALVADADVGPANDVSNRDQDEDLGEPLPHGGLCPEPGTIEGSCDPVLQDCGPGEICDFQFVSQTPLTFRTGCRAAGDLTYDLALDERCETDATDRSCEPGLLCRIDRCAQICRRADGAGCQTDEFCTAFSEEIGGYGICTVACQIP